MTYPPQAIGLSVRLVDYDNVYIEGGDPRKRLPDGITNKEREIPANLVCSWQLVSGQGELYPVGGQLPFHDYVYLPNAFVYPLPDVVWVKCTITDTNPDYARRDGALTIDFVFLIVGEPTLHIGAQADSGGTPVASAQASSMNLRTEAWFLQDWLGFGVAEIGAPHPGMTTGNREARVTTTTVCAICPRMLRKISRCWSDSGGTGVATRKDFTLSVPWMIKTGR